MTARRSLQLVLTVLTAAIVTVAVAPPAAAAPLQFTFDFGSGGQLAFELPGLPAEEVLTLISPTTETIAGITISHVGLDTCGITGGTLWTLSTGVASPFDCGIVIGGDPALWLTSNTLVTVPGGHSHTT
jgi:hypothetical protein